MTFSWLRKFFSAAILFCIAAAVTVTAQVAAPPPSADDGDFKAIKNLDLFFSAFRELKLFYVDDIDAEKVITDGINGMLSELDPYTEYMTEEESKKFDVATTGEYGGIGSLIRRQGDYTEVSEVYQGFPADKAGLVSGDLLLAIDDVSLKGKSVSEASDMLKGEKGTTLKIKAVKVKTKDTVELKIAREKIHISGVTYSGIHANGVGYIRLSSFTQGCSRDFKKAFENLKSSGELKSLVIDLRGNGGGLVDDAIKILSLFVPKGTEVLQAKGRIKEFDKTYKTEEQPLDVSIPIAVLVDQGSASSSEIVAGAIQDLDRGIIIGTQTFGKGLVQAVRPLGYNARLKITTAKYYTPSGRCVQAHNFSKRNEDGSVAFIADSLKQEFRTRNGRPVFDGGGITPDVVDSVESYSNIAASLIIRGLISDYSVQYYVKHSSVEKPEVFELSDAEYDDFVSFLSDKEYDYTTRSEALFTQLNAAIKKEKYDDMVTQELEAMRLKLVHDKQKDLYTFKAEIKQAIEEEIAVRYYYQAGRIRAILKNDKQVALAVDYLNAPEKYQSVLQPLSQSKK